jgi:hypothetical protein
MKKLDLVQMELINGSTNGRNCMLLTMAGTCAMFIPGGGWMVGAGLLGAAAQADCF